MALQLAAATRNAMANAAVDLVDAGDAAGTITIYDGSQPATADTAVGAQTALAVFTLDATAAFGDAAAGVATLDASPALTTTGDAAGTATWFRLQSEDTGGAATVLDGAVSTSGGGGQLILNTTTISVSVNVEITSGTFTVPASAA